MEFVSCRRQRRSVNGRTLRLNGRPRDRPDAGDSNQDLRQWLSPRRRALERRWPMANSSSVNTTSRRAVNGGNSPFLNSARWGTQAHLAQFRDIAKGLASDAECLTYQIACLIGDLKRAANGQPRPVKD